MPSFLTTCLRVRSIRPGVKSRNNYSHLLSHTRIVEAHQCGFKTEWAAKAQEAKQPPANLRVGG